MRINFYIDSQSAIKALKSYTVRLKSVADCKRYLNKLWESNNEVTLNWMPGHVGQPGNTIADHLAKRGTELEDEGAEPRMPVSESVIRDQINRWKTQEHTIEWHKRTDCRQTKLVLPDAEHDWGAKILNYERRHIRVLTQLVTGHANLKRHRQIMGMEEEESCDFCGESQTSIHILTECPKFYELRKEKLGDRIILDSSVRFNKLGKILQFARKTGLWNSLEEL